ncbi:MAG TPA: ThiF family adenylyltransferase [Candidatus Aquicultor sp.]|jgi:molybdopterin/thiamine biosynthesis adenylyltransferase
MNSKRYERQIGLFGQEGQAKLKKARVAVVGVGGLGSHVAQQLSFLGVGFLSFIDSDELEEHNLNRLIGARFDDPIPGTKKVDIAQRLVKSIDPSIEVNPLPVELRTLEAFIEVKKADYIFGCVDNDGARLVLNEICCAYQIPYIDLATDVLVEGYAFLLKKPIHNF